MLGSKPIGGSATSYLARPFESGDAVGLEERPEAESFCCRIRPRLVGALSLYCGDAQVAEDTAQEALARVWDRWDEVSQMASPDGWAYRVAINLANSWFRRTRARRNRERRMSQQQTGRATSDTAEALAVRGAVSELPSRQREALILRFFEDLSVRRTAQLMGCAEGTVKALTHQGLASLRGNPTVKDLIATEVSDV